MSELAVRKCANRECFNPAGQPEKPRSLYCSKRCQSREQNLRQGRIKGTSTKERKNKPTVPLTVRKTGPVDFNYPILEPRHKRMKEEATISLMPAVWSELQEARFSPSVFSVPPPLHPISFTPSPLPLNFGEDLEPFAPLNFRSARPLPGDVLNPTPLIRTSPQPRTVSPITSSSNERSPYISPLQNSTQNLPSLVTSGLSHPKTSQDDEKPLEEPILRRRHVTQSPTAFLPVVHPETLVKESETEMSMKRRMATSPTNLSGSHSPLTVSAQHAFLPISFGEMPSLLPRNAALSPDFLLRPATPDLHFVDSFLRRNTPTALLSSVHASSISSSSSLSAYSLSSLPSSYPFPYPPLSAPSVTVSSSSSSELHRNFVK